jgi:hypothetical protein
LEKEEEEEYKREKEELMVRNGEKRSRKGGEK